MLDAEDGDTRAWRTALFLALFGYASTSAAASFAWDGTTAIPVGLQARSETVLRMPERIAKYWSEDAPAISVSPVDTRTFSIKPIAVETEQRLFMRGESGKIFVAKVSTALSHYPVIEVRDVTPTDPATKDGSPPRSLSALSPTSLLVKMMRSETAAGFSVARSERRILTSDQFVVDAREVWSSPVMTGIVTRITRVAPAGTRVELKPAAMEIFSPELGQFRLIGADRWVLDDETPETVGYLVFTKG